MWEFAREHYFLFFLLFLSFLWSIESIVVAFLNRNKSACECECSVKTDEIVAIGGEEVEHED
jgi:hypothetical protein